MKCIEIKNLCKSFNKNFDAENKHKNVLNDINLTVESGLIYSLIGPSGCGKTTLINCLLGIQNFHSGEIRIFNQQVEYEKTTKFAHLIGFMPQQISLASGLTIKEILQYFANLHQLKSEMFKERYEIITKMLDLSSNDLIIQQLSGGEQRRVSLAVAIIHNPKILVLDEPTVGLDVLLCDRVWNFLKQQAEEKNLTILMTTHYLNEATKAHRCGFMRNGFLIVEDNANNIMENLNTSTLDEAFLLICQGKEIQNFCENHEILEDEEKFEIFNENKFIRPKVLKGLIMFEIHRLKRQPIEIFWMFVSLIFHFYIFSNVIGTIPTNFKFGVVNANNINCNSTSINICNENEIFCEFFNQLESIELIKCENYEKCYEDFMESEIFGILSLPQNFRNLIIENEENSTQTKSIEILLNYSKFPFLLFIQQNLQKAFQKSIENLSKNCDIKNYLLIKPIKIEEAIFAPLTFETKIYQAVVNAAIMPFPAIVMFSTFTFTQSRQEGVWNRTIFSGVKISEILFANLLECLFIATSYTAQIIFSLKFILKIEIIGNFALTLFLILSNIIVGYLFGFIVAILSDKYEITVGIGSMLCYFIVITSGILWPLEGASYLIQPLCYAFPTSMTADSLRNVILKGLGIQHPSIYKGIMSTGLWISICLVASFISLKYRKFTK